MRTPNLSNIHVVKSLPNPIRLKIDPREIPRGGSRDRGTALSMNTLKVIETIAPRLGIFTSTALYFSPASAVWAAVRANNVGDLNPLPLGIMSVSSISWLVYGLSVRDPFVALSNILGCIASIAYVIGVLPLLGGGGDGRQLRTMQGVVIAGAAVCISLWTSLVLSNASIARASSILGFFASGLFIVLSGSPLSTIGKVVKTKNASSILAPFMLAQVLNTSLWSMYGLVIKDKFVWGPNIVSFILGLVQLVLKLLFPANPRGQQ